MGKAKKLTAVALATSFAFGGMVAPAIVAPSQVSAEQLSDYTFEASASTYKTISFEKLFGNAPINEGTATTFKIEVNGSHQNVLWKDGQAGASYYDGATTVNLKAGAKPTFQFKSDVVGSNKIKISYDHIVRNAETGAVMDIVTETKTITLNIEDEYTQPELVDLGKRYVKIGANDTTTSLALYTLLRGTGVDVDGEDFKITTTVDGVSTVKNIGANGSATLFSGQGLTVDMVGEEAGQVLEFNSTKTLTKNVYFTVEASDGSKAELVVNVQSTANVDGDTNEPTEPVVPPVDGGEGTEPNPTEPTNPPTDGGNDGEGEGTEPTPTEPTNPPTDGGNEGDTDGEGTEPTPTDDEGTDEGTDEGVTDGEGTEPTPTDNEGTDEGTDVTDGDVVDEGTDLDLPTDEGTVGEPSKDGDKVDVTIEDGKDNTSDTVTVDGETTTPTEDGKVVDTENEYTFEGSDIPQTGAKETTAGLGLGALLLGAMTFGLYNKRKKEVFNQ